MRKRKIAFGASVVVGLTVWAFAAADDPVGKEKVTKIRVGTFDSRAVAMAHFGKMLKDGWLKKLYSEHEKAKAEGTKYSVECILCGRRFDIPATKEPVVPFHLGSQGFRCPGANHPGRVVKAGI